MNKLFITAIACFCFFTFVRAQVKIGDNPGVLQSSALLELESTNKGLLLPRLTRAQMNGISNPARGLLVFNSTDSVFCLRLDSGWTSLAMGINPWRSESNNIFNINSGRLGIGTSLPEKKLDVKGNVKIDSSIYLPNTTDTGREGVIYKNGLPFLHNAGQIMSNVYLGTNAGSFNPLAKKNVAIGQLALAASDGADNVAIGWMAANKLTGGSSYTESFKNTFIGYLCGTDATGGINNVSIGEEAGYNLMPGSSGNVLVGAGAGYFITTGVGNCLIGNNVQTSTGYLNSGVGGNSGGHFTSGSYNSWIGSGALNNNKTGWYNTALGAFSQNEDTSGGLFNVYLGAFAGLHTQGASNVFLGAFSGYNDAALISNTLIINNSDANTHLINGKFNLHQVGINKTLDDLLYTLDVGGEMRVGTLAGNPAASNGVFYYNSTQAKYKAFENGAWKDMVNENKVKSKNGNPNTSDIPDGFFHVWKNTSNGNIYLWVNDGGVMKNVQLQ